MSQEPCSGRQLLEMFTAGALLLEQNAQAVNALNVFPVPDGDTGTNMLLTLKATLEEAGRCGDGNVGDVATAMARGSLLGARGNSGVILSQFFRGLAQGLDAKEDLSPREFAAALKRASAAAYQGVSRPVEGTMLTVLREAADSAQKAAGSHHRSLVAVMEVATRAAQEAVARTPSQLPILQEAGVVDAGGQGLSLFLEGALHCLKGTTPHRHLMAAAPASNWDGATETGYGYCTEFLLRGPALDVAALRGRIEAMGESVLVVGDSDTARVHVHTPDPGAVLSYAVSQGTLNKVKVDNIDAQHQDFLALKGKTGRVGVVAVVNGEGLAQVCRSLGAAAIVRGGQTMNPSVQELLQAADAVAQEEVILLPNNVNIIATAGKVEALTRKRIAVIPSRSIVQGIAALLALNPEAELAANRSAMAEACRRVVSAEVTRAVRSMKIGELSVREGNAIGLIEEELVVAKPGPVQALWEVLKRLALGEGRLLTIYYGEETDNRRLEKLLPRIERWYPGQEVEVVFGGQPHYPYLVSLE